jgi:hypothetical protein
MRRVLATAPLIAALLVTGRCPAADPEQQVRVTVAAILASADGKVDPKLKCIAEQVRKTHPELTGFQAGQSTTLPIALGGTETFKLVDGQEATVLAKRCKDCPERFCLEVKSKALLGEMTYTSVCGKYFPLITGYTTKDKHQLIIVLKVEACADKKKPSGGR